MKLLDVSYHGSYFDLSCDQYLQKGVSNIGYANFLGTHYKKHFIFHSGCSKIIHKDGVTYQFRKKRWNSKLLFPIRLSLLLKKQAPDVIIIHSVLYIHFAALLRLFVGTHTIILIQHHGGVPRKSIVKNKIIRISNSYIDGYLFASQKLAKTWIDQKLLTASKVFEVMEGSTTFGRCIEEVETTLVNVSNDVPVFLWVGRLNANKDPLCALKACKLLKDSGQKFVLYMFYHTEELLAEITLFIKENDLTDYVFLKGKIPHKSLQEWYCAADYFIAASHNEGSGYALCEAMACNCIPVISKIPSFEYMTKDGYAGLLFETGNASHFYEQLSNALQLDKKLYQERVAQVFRERLSFEAIANTIDSVIKELSARKINRI